MEHDSEIDFLAARGYNPHMAEIDFESRQRIQILERSIESAMRAGNWHGRPQLEAIVRDWHVSYSAAQGAARRVAQRLTDERATTWAGELLEPLAAFAAQAQADGDSKRFESLAKTIAYVRGIVAREEGVRLAKAEHRVNAGLTEEDLWDKAALAHVEVRAKHALQ